jgi:transposase
MPGPSKDHLKHLSEEERDEAIDQAQSNDEPYLVRRLCLIKNIYLGDTLTEAATRVGVTTPTASRWVNRWNTDAVDGLRPSSSSGRPPKLDEHQRERLREVLKQHQPLTTRQVQQLIENGFDVSYSQRHTSRLLNKLGLNYAIPRPESPDRPDDAEEQLEERLEAALDDLERIDNIQ